MHDRMASHPGIDQTPHQVSTKKWRLDTVHKQVFTLTQNGVPNNSQTTVLTGDMPTGRLGAG
jgi:hypothetical protein